MFTHRVHKTHGEQEAQNAKGLIPVHLFMEAVGYVDLGASSVAAEGGKTGTHFIKYWERLSACGCSSLLIDKAISLAASRFWNLEFTQVSPLQYFSDGNSHANSFLS